MTQEEKQLLLKDLCARLPYHDLWVQYDNKDWLAFGYGHGRIELLSSVFSSAVGPCPLVEEVRPYLRPMSSMTEEEGKELERLFCEIDATWRLDTKYGCLNFAGGNDFIDTEMLEVYTDWLNKNHFDYRGLIEKGLAFEAPEGMYKNEKDEDSAV